MNTKQSTFGDPEAKVRGVLSRASDRDFEHVVCAVSGGTDSVLAAHVAATLGPEYGIEPDVVLHANTGVGIPQTQLVAQLIAALHDIPYVEGNNGTLAERTLEHGWPAGKPAGHFYERIERKSDVFDKYHSTCPQEQLWISGARSTESKQRSMNMPDSGVSSDSRRTRQVWASPINGLTSSEKWEWIAEERIPVSESYYWLGISGECVACSYDDAGLLADLDMLAPNLSWAIRNLTVMLAMRARRGDVDITPKQLCWGWLPETDDVTDRSDQETLVGYNREDETDDRAATVDDDDDPAWIGCNASACGERDVPEQVFDLPHAQIIDRDDVRQWYNGERAVILDRFH